MKNYISILAIFAFFLMAIPGIALLRPLENSANEAAMSSDGAQKNLSVGDRLSFQNDSSNAAGVSSDENPEAAASADSSESDPKKGQSEPESGKRETVRVLFTDDGTVQELPMRDYLIGAVLAEMPAGFHPEALKAQAVAAHTYALRQKIREAQFPTAELQGADFSDDPSKYQAFFTQAQARAFYGEQYEENCRKITEAVDSVLPYVLTCENEPIAAAFHSMSSGRTEAAEDVWGSPLSYLVPVESPGDPEAPAFTAAVTFTAAEFSARMTTAFSDVQLTGDPGGWVAVQERTETGMVKTCAVGGRDFSGTQLRGVLSLRSANFTVNWDREKEQFQFVTRGNGHGVGLSQYGANAMAEAGSSYEEILLHYYTGVELTEWTPA